MRGTSASEVFDSALRRDPDAVAVIDDERTWTFADLDSIVVAVEGALGRTADERRVAFLGERTVAFPAAVLAVLRNEDVLVPIEMGWPEARSEEVLRASGASAVLVSGGAAVEAAERCGLDVIRLDEILGSTLMTGTPNVADQAIGAQPLRGGYLMYTSGSTGRPKGVLTPQTRLGTHGERLAARLGLTAADRVLQFTSASIDIALEELFIAWSVGAAVVTLPEAVRADLTAFTEHAEHHGVTFMDLPTSFWRAWLAAAESGDVAGPAPALRAVGVGSEPVAAADIERWLALGTDPPAVFNLYGATETSITTVVDGPIRRGASVAVDSIGTPLDGVESYVLDDDLRPVAVGERGQLYVRGDVTGWGYDRDGAATAAAFVPDPFGRPGGRMYATGDAVTAQADGRLVFHGRLDSVLMVRGYSVDPDAVASVLGEVAGVARVDIALDEATGRLRADITPGEISSAVVGAWRDVYDALYETDMQDREPTFNPATWFSALDGSRLPDDVMAGWLLDIVSKISDLAPRRVLDLGCGTGMVMNALGPALERYVGVDISPVALGAAASTIEAVRGDAEISLVEGAALEATNTIDETFDTVLLNSVVQYFPDADHLEAVILGASRLVAPGGHIVIGDVRNLDLDDEYGRWTGRRADVGEHELLLAPAYFARLRTIGGRPVRVDVTVKYTDDGSEMERFRYDVVLTMDADVDAALRSRSAGSYVGVRPSDLDERTIAGLADAGTPVLVRGTDRTRFAVGAARRRLREDGYFAEAAPSAGSSMLCDLVVARPSDAARAQDVLRTGLEGVASAPVVNDPREQDRRTLVATMREQADRRLPEHERPGVYRIAVGGEFVEPRDTPAEFLVDAADTVHDDGSETAHRIARIWHEVLDGQRVGLDDDFFDLGGNSLSLARVIARVRTVFGVDVSVAEFFASSRLRDLARLVDDRSGSAPVELQRTALEVSGAQDAPASSAQERLWVLDGLYPGSTMYHSPFTFEVDGPVVHERLVRAADALVRAHPVLRTALEFVDGALRQRVTDARPVVEEIVGDETAFVDRPFDLSSGELCRIGWRRIDQRRHRLVVVVHHVAIDEFSLEPFFDAFATAYQATNHVAGVPDIPAPSATYVDYALWERSVDVAPLEAFWRDYLDGAPTTVEFPLDGRRPMVARGRGERCQLDVTAEQDRAVAALVAREGLTEYQFWLAVFGLFVAREAGADDVLIGAPSGARHFPELESVVGFFVNTVPVRLDRSANPTFSEWLRDSSRSLLRAVSGDQVPLQRIAQVIGAERNLAHNPLFQTMVVLEPAEQLRMDLGKAVAVAVDEPERTSTVDLSLIVRPRDSRTDLHFVYNPDLFDEVAVERMRRRFTGLLDVVLGDPALRVGDSALWAALDASALTGESVSEVPRLTVVEQFRHVARSCPGEVAVVSADGPYTYRELGDAVDSLTASLIALGPFRPYVPVVLQSSPEMITAMLAVNAAGAAFVPIDPGWPRVRIEAVLDDIGADVMIDETGARRIAEPRQDASAPSRGDELDGAMYAIYTSGSTGSPKGAVNLHRGVVNRLDWMRRTLPEGAGRVVLQTTPPHYDSCVWEYFWPLVNGGTTVIGAATLQADPASVCREVQRHGVTTIDMVPGLFRRVVERASVDPVVRDQLRTLVVAVVGGEELTVRIAELIAEAALPVQVVNLYGPTEAAIGSIAHVLTTNSSVRIPIGHPIQNTSAFVLDAQFEPVPAGIIGELFLGGDCVGDGYLGNRRETRRRFIDTSRWGRIYRTGDAARVRSDGALEFLGRLDHQANLMGVRVEPAEIARAIEEAPGVAEAAVVEVEHRVPIAAALLELMAQIEESADPQAIAAAEALVRTESRA